MTNRYHDWKQMKNKYEALKKDWGSWMRLKDPRNGCTGLGYDQLHGIFTIPNHWWDKMMLLDKNCGKFKGKTLEHMDLMEQIFGRKSQWTQGKDLPSMALIDESSGSSDEAPTDDFGVGLGGSERTPSVEIQWGKRRVDGPSSCNKSARGKKMSAAARLSRTMDKMLEVVQSQGSELIIIPANREVFMGLPNDDVRLAWLQLHRDQVAGTAPPPFPAPYPYPRPPTPSYYHPRQS
ncbi:hypothetical protein Acr_22g0008140 [Actinidia rufa]|uniref:Myb/SANT-like domain-containing protein n=1 Tax=Actinidia rufa TaxID=165716 RepID=A0A7J0GKT4_9ERIC|nr:hypothetical protein Acr_22g0008140 [Actinidia rufa]